MGPVGATPSLARGHAGLRPDAQGVRPFSQMVFCPGDSLGLSFVFTAGQTSSFLVAD